MRVARYWRMKEHNYRLEGIAYETGEVSLQNRPVIETTAQDDNDETELTPEERVVTAA